LGIKKGVKRHFAKRDGNFLGFVVEVVKVVVVLKSIHWLRQFDFRRFSISLRSNSVSSIFHLEFEAIADAWHYWKQTVFYQFELIVNKFTFLNCKLIKNILITVVQAIKILKPTFNLR